MMENSSLSSMVLSKDKRIQKTKLEAEFREFFIFGRKRKTPKFFT